MNSCNIFFNSHWRVLKKSVLWPNCDILKHFKGPGLSIFGEHHQNCKIHVIGFKTLLSHALSKDLLRGNTEISLIFKSHVYFFGVYKYLFNSWANNCLINIFPIFSAHYWKLDYWNLSRDVTPILMIIASSDWFGGMNSSRRNNVSNVLQKKKTDQPLIVWQLFNFSRRFNFHGAPIFGGNSFWAGILHSSICCAYTAHAKVFRQYCDEREHNCAQYWEIKVARMTEFWRSCDLDDSLKRLDDSS